MYWRMWAPLPGSTIQRVQMPGTPPPPWGWWPRCPRCHSRPPCPHTASQAWPPGSRSHPPRLVNPPDQNMRWKNNILNNVYTTETSSQKSYLDTTLGDHNVPSCQQGAPQSKCSICVDRMLAGGQHTEIKPHQVILGHIVFTVVRTKPHVSMAAKICLDKMKNRPYIKKLWFQGMSFLFKKRQIAKSPSSNFDHRSLQGRWLCSSHHHIKSGKYQKPRQRSGGPHCWPRRHSAWPHNPSCDSGPPQISHCCSPPAGWTAATAAHGSGCGHEM